jgi:hypothetical protein
MASDSFTDPSILKGESYSHALARVNTAPDTSSEEFQPDNELAVYVDEEGTVNTLGTIYSYASRDPIECETTPEFNPENNFIRGLQKALSPGVPVGGVIAYSTGGLTNPAKQLPAGYAPCNGGIYRRADGSLWTVPAIASVGFGTIYIQRLPADAVYTGRQTPLFFSSLSS